MITVVDPGVFTTVQDMGRFGYGAHGVPRCGAMDPWALRAANVLVGNDVGAAALEITSSGPALAFERDAVVAIAGARCALPHERAFRVRAGETIEVGKLLDGARSVLAVRGGLATQPVLGSRSSFGARPLRAGDVVPVGGAPASPTAPLRRLTPGALTRASTLRAIAATDDPDPHDALFESAWTVTPEAARSGIRLAGPSLPGGEIDPQGMVPGVVQVPPGGAPIVLGPDGPVTGGYRVAATVIAADAGLLAYLRPGDEVRFDRVHVEQAREAWYVRERALRDGIEDVE